ncbi:MAG: AraC family transcriptional regulator [Oscillospiraceae bacterium]|nr:AraC family transcriptional regulator [Oscillospiraceae bacterium]
MNRTLLKRLSKITDEEQRLLNGSKVDMEMYASGRGSVIDSAKMLEKGHLISIRPHTRFAPFPKHTHNYIEIIYMCSGSTTHIINDKTKIVLNSGELLFINQHACHAIEYAGRDDIAVNFIVLPEFFDITLSMIGPDNAISNFLISGLRQSNGDIGSLHFRVADILPVQNLVENLIWSIVNRQPNYRRIHQLTMGLLFVHLLNNTERLNTAYAPYGANAMILACLREIEENCKSANLSSVAKSQGVSPAYLSKLVKQSTGSSFKELLVTKRLTKAAQLLRDSRLPVHDIIAAVGYDNTSYFYRIFKDKYRQSPKAYRSSYQVK